MNMRQLLAFALALPGIALAAPRGSGNEYFPAVKDLGNVMFIGAAATQGVITQSYRWPLFKIWVDNAISRNAVGVHQGSYRKGTQLAGSIYGKVAFSNVHSAHVFERAYEVSGRNNNSERLEGSNIYDWLGLDKTYNGYRRIDPATQNPASYFLMIGMSDLMFDSGKEGISSGIEKKQVALLGKGGDMDTIVKAMRQANPQARIAVLTLPTWAPERLHNSKPEDYASLRRYNEALKAWGKARQLAVIDVNHGLVDVSSGSFAGAADLYAEDKLTPGQQAELIIAGNIARQLGYAGRTAGLKRWPAKEFPLHMAEMTQSADKATISKKGVLTLKGRISYSAAENEAAGATLELRFAKNGYGNGAKGGWDKKKHLVAELLTHAGTGRLSVSESSIRWGEGWGRTLYSGDMSRIGERAIRVAYTAGNPIYGVAAGFYVWLGDMLIGEALPGSRETGTGIDISPGSSVALTRLDYDPQKAWAPDTRLFRNGNPLMDTPAAKPASASPTGHSVLPSPTGGTRGGFNLCSGRTMGNVNASFTTPGPSPEETPAANRPNALCTGEMVGSVSLEVAPAYAGTQPWSPFFASMKGKGISGDASLEVDSDAFYIRGAKFGPVSCALAGAYESPVAGCVRFLLHKGQYEGSIYGGNIGRTDTIGMGSTHIELGDVTVAGDVYGGGLSGTIAGDTALVIDGAACMGGQHICAGGHMGLPAHSGGKIMGGSSVTLRNAAPGSQIAAYRGKISGGENVAGPRRLVLDKVTMGTLHASLADFDEIHVTNSSVVSLDSLGGARKLIVDSTSRLTLEAGNCEAAVHNAGSIELAQGCTLTLLKPGSDGSGAGRYTVRKGATLDTNALELDNDIHLQK